MNEDCNCNRVANQYDNLYRKHIVAEFYVNGVLKDNAELTAKVRRLEAHVKGMEQYARRHSKNGFIQITEDEVNLHFN